VEAAHGPSKIKDNYKGLISMACVFAPDRHFVVSESENTQVYYFIKLPVK
jgi:hypothetical protein